MLGRHWRPTATMPGHRREGKGPLGHGDKGPIKLIQPRCPAAGIFHPHPWRNRRGLAVAPIPTGCPEGVAGSRGAPAGGPRGAGGGGVAGERAHCSLVTRWWRPLRSDGRAGRAGGGGRATAMAVWPWGAGWGPSPGPRGASGGPSPAVTGRHWVAITVASGHMEGGTIPVTSGHLRGAHPHCDRMSLGGRQCVIRAPGGPGGICVASRCLRGAHPRGIRAPKGAPSLWHQGVFGCLSLRHHGATQRPSPWLQGTSGCLSPWHLGVLGRPSPWYRGTSRCPSPWHHGSLGG